MNRIRMSGRRLQQRGGVDHDVEVLRQADVAGVQDHERSIEPVRGGERVVLVATARSPTVSAQLWITVIFAGSAPLPWTSRDAIVSPSATMRARAPHQEAIEALEHAR